VGDAAAGVTTSRVIRWRGNPQRRFLVFALRYRKRSVAGSTTSYGGGAARITYSTVTNIQWLPATAANVAKTLVTIPRGFRHV
jgi:hypothetical protein